jgi:hypothetical protein
VWVKLPSLPRVHWLPEPQKGERQHPHLTRPLRRLPTDNLPLLWQRRCPFLSAIPSVITQPKDAAQQLRAQRLHPAASAPERYNKATPGLPPVPA